MAVDFDKFVFLGREAKRLGLSRTLEGLCVDLVKAYENALNVHSYAWFRSQQFTYPTEEMINLIRQGKKIDSVKLYCESNGPGTLLASKVIMEAVACNLGFAPQYHESLKEVKFT